jgi:tetratricopeptide (TPR) repeat protein
MLDRGETRRIGDEGDGPDAPEDSPTRVDRYVVLELLGAGGMGVVYAAYDPVLDRKVALKLLHSSSEDEKSKTEGRTRLLREAQAIARLNHPHVVSVFDVGMVGDRVYMATEFLDGVSLKRWLREQKRELDEILTVFRQAGRGLAAAHAAGLIHRDFKPANVLVPQDGRVRVLDFGLARAAGMPEPEPGTKPATDGGTLDRSMGQTGLLETPLTLSGAVIGTPAYMAPEQHLDEETDARTDQFSFCVTLYEALYGIRPYAGDRYEDLKTAVVEGRVREPPSEAAAPAWLKAVVLRGLQVDPNKRYPSMDALLGELSRDPMGARRRLTLGVFALAAVAVIGYAVRGQDEGSQRCQGASEHLAEVWNDQTRDSIRSSFAATDQVFSAKAFDGVNAAFDEYAGTWTTNHTDACEAHHVRGEQSAELMDRRMLCLDRGRAALVALAGVFAEADAEVVKNAVSAVQGLPDLSACSDLEALNRGKQPDADPETRAAAAEVREVLARADALRRAGKYGLGLPEALKAAERSSELDDASLRAEILTLQARLQDASGEPATAEQTFHQASVAAELAEDDSIRAEIAAHLVWVTAHRLSKADQGEHLAARANAIVKRAGRKDLEPFVLENLAVVHSDQGQHDAAVEAMQQALELWTDQLKPTNLRLAGSRNRLGAILFQRGDHDQALPHYEAALEVRTEALGPDHPLVAHTIGNIALVHFTRGDVERALEEYKASQEILERAVEPGNLELARGYMNLGGVVARMGDYEQARDYQAKAEAIFRDKLGPEHPLTASATYTHGQALAGLERVDEALVLYERALSSWEKSLGTDHPQLAHALTAMGLVYLSQHKAAEAVSVLERARQIRSAAEEKDTSLLAETDFALARARWAAGADKDAALALAREAAAAYRAAGAAHDKEAAEIDAWLAENG